MIGNKIARVSAALPPREPRRRSGHAAHSAKPRRWRKWWELSVKYGGGSLIAARFDPQKKHASSPSADRLRLSGMADAGAAVAC